MASRANAKYAALVRKQEKAIQEYKVRYPFVRESTAVRHMKGYYLCSATGNQRTQGVGRERQRDLSWAPGMVRKLAGIYVDPTAAWKQIDSICRFKWSMAGNKFFR